jgi:hypothetical protein
MPHLREPPTVRQAPPETLGDVVGRILRLEEPPDEIGPYAIAYHIKHGIVAPTREWLANEPHVYLDADHNVRTSSVHRDYSHEMAPVLAEVALMLAPSADALARSFAARGPKALSGMGDDVAHAVIHREIAHGERVSSIVNEVADLTRRTRLEHSVASLADGRRVIVYGGRDGIDFARMDIRRILGHSHPPGSLPGPSSEDAAAMGYYFQRSSWLIEVGPSTSQVSRIRVP